MSEFIEYPDTEFLAMSVANKIAGDLRAQLQQEDRVLFVVPGGTTPGPVFDDLCEADLDWSRVDVLLSDERWVPEVHIRSNTKLIRERLLVGRAAAARYLPMFAKAHEPEEVLADLEANIVPNLPVSVCLLGMGADMHTASLFPRADNLEDALSRDAPVLMPMRVPDQEDVRITLTARVLNDAMAKHVLIIGDAKRAAYERAIGLPDMEAPVRAVLDGAKVHWSPAD